MGPSITIPKFPNSGMDQPQPHKHRMSKFAQWLWDSPSEPTMWDRVQYPLKWCIVITGLVGLSAFMLVGSVLVLPLIVLKMGLF